MFSAALKVFLMQMMMVMLDCLDLKTFYFLEKWLGHRTRQIDEGIAKCHGRCLRSKNPAESVEKMCESASMGFFVFLCQHIHVTKSLCC